jgi:hypothetical protein
VNFREPGARIYIDDGYGDANRQQIENEAKKLQPARDDAQFFAELRALLLAAFFRSTSWKRFDLLCS